jgi:hypothetical protein
MILVPKNDIRALTIPAIKIPSWNELYEQTHWSKRSQLAKDIHYQVRAALDPSMPPFDGLVDIEIIGYFVNRPLDPDNIASKIFIDGLKGWWIADDTPDYVRSVTTRSVIDKDSPRLEIIVAQVSDPFRYRCSCCERAWPTRQAKKAHEKTMGICEPQW